MFKKSLQFLLLLTVIIAPWGVKGQTVTIGTGTTAQRTAPIANYRNYSLCEMLFTSTEIGETDVNTIINLGFEGVNGSSKTYSITIYMKNVAAESFTADADYIQVANEDIVFTGTIKPATGWNTIDLDTPFTYDNTKSLLVVVNKTSKLYDSNTSIWKYTDTEPSYKMFYAESDYTSYDPTTITYLSRDYQRPNVQLTFGTATCLKPTILPATDITSNSATVSFTEKGTASSWVLQYSTTSDFSASVEEVTDFVEAGGNQTAALTGLTATTTYYARVKADCTGGDYSKWSTTISFTTTAQPTVVGNSWSDDFEGESCGWQLVNGDLTNKWCWGTAVYNGGTHALYVSNDGGTSNTYTNNKEVMVYATKLLQFADNEYVFSYDWIAKGESNGNSVYDYLRVALVPASVTLTPGTSVPTGFSATALPTGWIAVDGGSYLNGVTTWQNKSVTINVSAGNYYLVMAWRNNNSGGSNPPAAVDNITITRVACGYDVAGLEVATEPAPTAHTATINWTDGNPGQWQVAWSKDNTFAPANTQTETVSTNTINLVNLDAASTYYVKVRAYCGGEDYGEWCEAVDFQTECEAISDFPWSYNFNSDAEGVFSKLCWVNEAISGSDKFEVSNLGHGSNSTNQLYIPRYNGTNAKLVLPELAIPTGKNYQFIIDLYRTYVDVSYNDGIRVYASTSSNLEDAQELGFLYRVCTKTDGGVVTSETNPGWYTYTFDIPSNKNRFIILKGEGTGGQHTYVDNFVIRQAPDCDTPTGLAVTANSQTPEGATITWNNVDETSWIVEYKVSTEDNYTAIAEPVNEATYTFTGLNYSTTYNVRVKVNCTEGDGVTYPTDPVNFTTKVQFPAPTNLATSNITHESATLSWTAGYTNQTAWKVQYKKSADSWTDAATIVNAPTIDLTELVENTTYDVRIYGGQGENFGTDYLSGNFTTQFTCAAPTDLVTNSVTSQSATLSWTPGYQETSWTVKYKPSTVISWNDEAVVTVENATKPLTINSLTSATTYDVRVYNCLGEDPLTGSFLTAYSLPFTEEFSSTSIPTNWENKLGLLDNVIAGTALTSGSQWLFGPSNHVFNQHARINIYGGTANSTASYGWLITPNITLGSNYSLSFDMALTNYTTDPSSQVPLPPSTDGTDDKFIVLISTDNEATWTVLRQWDNEGSSYVYNDIALTGEAVYIDLAAYNNQTVRIAFYGESTVANADNNLHIDNVEVNISNDCYKPTNVASSNVTNHSATITWTPGTVGQELWQLKYNKDDDFDPNTEGTAIVVETDPTYTFDKTLDAASVYYVYVRGNCGTTSEPDYSPWSKKCTFSTGAASPAPTTFARTDVGPDWVDLYWNAPEGDFLSGYGIYYSTASTAPTAETDATVTINDPTAPTSEAPYRLTGLTSETTYYIWVRANHETDVYSAWKAITGASFTTLVACPAPTGLAANNITTTTADLSWTGYSDSYTVQKRAAASPETIYLSEDFETGSLPTGWDNTQSSNSSRRWGIGAGAGADFSGNPAKNAANGNYNANMFWQSSDDYAYLITPSINLGGVTDVSLYFNYVNPAWSTGRFALAVYYRVDGGSWNQLAQYTDSHDSWTEASIPLTGMADNYQIAFYGKGYNNNYGYGIGIDDVIVCNMLPAGEWADVANNVTETYYPLTGLTTGTKYNVRVKGNCDPEGEYSNIISFTTLSETIIDDPEEMTNIAATECVIVKDGGVLTLTGTNSGNANNLIVEDGGQLILPTTATNVAATVQKKTTASEAKTSNAWYAIASPINNGVIADFVQGTHNVYRYDEENIEWEEYRNTSNLFTTFENGRGYLYRSTVANVEYAGTVNAAAVNYTLSYACDNASFKGFNLIGNPFTHDIYKGAAGTAIPNGELLEAKYCVLNTDGTWTLTSDGTAIPSGTAILVQAKSASQLTIANTNSTGSKGKAFNDNIWFTVKNSNFTDVACVEFMEGRGLNKMAHYNDNAPMLYVKHNGENFASVDMPDDTKTVNLCFKATEFGYNTLSLKANGNFSYLHLIDKLTGEDVDMLIDDEYSFIASPTDNPERFIVRLEYSEGSESSEVFAYQNGSDIIVSGEGELQVFDVMGRLVMQKNINGVERINAEAQGVYIFKLNEKTQKIVVR